MLEHWPSPTPLGVRCIEYHRYTAGGGLLSPHHRDVGSALTMSLLLAKPAEGGHFVTRDAPGGRPVVHALDAGDAVGEALACNCIGVAIQLRADGDDELNEAIKYHQQHLAVADVPGKFIAHCNLGLAYQALGRIDEATANHQHALRYAIRMSSLAGESLACGHLGMLGSADQETSRACTERQLQLARTLQDHRAAEDAYIQLGGLAQSAGAHEQAHHYFTEALAEAEAQHDAETADLARCQIGLADGGHAFEAFLQSTQP